MRGAMQFAAALLLVMQTAAPGAPSRADLEAPDALATRLSTRGVHILVPTADDGVEGRQSLPADRCYSQGELATGRERLCLYDCAGLATALPVDPGRTCPVSYRAAR